MNAASREALDKAMQPSPYNQGDQVTIGKSRTSWTFDYSYVNGVKRARIAHLYREIPTFPGSPVTKRVATSVNIDRLRLDVAATKGIQS